MSYPEVAIGSFCRTGSGGTPDRKKASLYYGGDIPWVKSGELQTGFVAKTEETITELALSETNVKMIPEGAVLVAMYGATVGKVARLGIPAASNQAICHIIPDPNVTDARYLQQAINWKVPELLAKRVGGAQPNISQSIIRETRIPLPPLSEQRRIVEILDLADEARRNQKEILRLTEEALRSAFLEMFGDPVTNPMGWDIVTLGELGTFVGGGTPSRKILEYYDGNICWATSKDMKGENLHDTQEHITEEAVDNSATKLVPEGTLLIVVKSKILAHHLPVLRAAVSTCFSQDIKGLLLKDPSSSRFVARHLRIGQEPLLQQARGVNTEGLTLEHLRNYQTMLPPQATIHRFEEIEVHTELTLRDLQIQQLQLDTLFNALVQAAFRGELATEKAKEVKGQLGLF